MDVFASDRARIWTTRSGTGTAVLLFNGGPGCDDYLGPVARMMDDRVSVIRFEPRGCGRSDRDGKYDLGTLLRDAEAIRESYGVDQWIVGGHSAGPDFALAYAMQYPDRVLGMFGIAGGRFVNDRDWSAAYHAALDAEGEDRGGLEFDADPAVNRVGNESWKAYIKRPRVWRDLADLSIPCVFINAGKDVRPNWPARQLAALIPKARYIEIADATHYVWVSHGQLLRRELQEALDYILE